MKHIKFIENKVTDIYVKLDNDNMDIQSVQSDHFSQTNSWVRIQRMETSFNTK